MSKIRKGFSYYLFVFSDFGSVKGKSWFKLG